MCSYNVLTSAVHIQVYLHPMMTIGFSHSYMLYKEKLVFQYFVTGIASFICFNTVQSEALNKTGKPIFFNSCEWGVDNPWEWMGQYANSWRTGPDHHDDWDSTSKIIEINAEGKGKHAGIALHVLDGRDQEVWLVVLGG